MAALIWLIVGIALVVGEVFTVDLTLLMLAAGAFAAAGTALLTDNIIIQVVVFALTSVLTIGGVRPFLKRRLSVHHADDGTPLSVAAIEGSDATVLERVDAESGLVRVQGETWSARAYDATQVIEPGERVKVVQVKGATALVWKD